MRESVAHCSTVEHDSEFKYTLEPNTRAEHTCISTLTYTRLIHAHHTCISTLTTWTNHLTWIMRKYFLPNRFHLTSSSLRVTCSKQKNQRRNNSQDDAEILRGVMSVQHRMYWACMYLVKHQQWIINITGTETTRHLRRLRYKDTLLRGFEVSSENSINQRIDSNEYSCKKRISRLLTNVIKPWHEQSGIPGARICRACRWIQTPQGGSSTHSIPWRGHQTVPGCSSWPAATRSPRP